MSPKRKPATTVLPLKMSSLAALLDLPAGVSVVKMGFKRDTTDTTAPEDTDKTFAILEGSESLVLHLDGVDMDKGETIDAEYEVDAHGRRSFTRFKPADGTPPDEDPNPEEKE